MRVGAEMPKLLAQGPYTWWPAAWRSSCGSSGVTRLAHVVAGWGNCPHWGQWMQTEVY